MLFNDGLEKEFFELKDKLEEYTYKINKIRSIIANDSYAITFQSMAQYRTALLKKIDKLLDA